MQIQYGTVSESNMYTAKEVNKEKFWIVNNNYGNVGTLRICDDGTYEFYDRNSNTKASIDDIKDLFTVESKVAKEINEAVVDGYLTGMDEVFDAEHSTYPVFKKTESANTLFAAGYYIIEFEGTGWQWAFAPKVNTLEKYHSVGPYQSEWEANLELKRRRRG